MTPPEPPIRGRWTICLRCWSVIARDGENNKDRAPVLCSHLGPFAEAAPWPSVPDEAAIERTARHIAEKRWATWLHPYKWDEVTERQRDAYRREAREVLRAALEAPEG